MSKIQLEELESRLVLSSFSASPDVSLPQPSVASAAYSSTAAPDASHASSLVRSGGAGVEMGQAQAPVPNTPFTETRVNVFAEELIVVGSQRVVIVEITFVPIVASFNFDFGQGANAGPENVLDTAQVARTPATNLSTGSTSPSASGAAMPTAVSEVAEVVAQATTASPGPAPIPTTGANPGILFNPNLAPSHSLPSLQGYSSPSDPAGPSGSQAQSWLFPPPPAAGLGAAPFLVPSLLGLRSLDEPALLPRPIPSLQLGPQGQDVTPLPELNLSGLQLRLQQFLGVFAPQGQQAISLPAPDLSALETGLMQFLADLGETSSQLAVGPEGAAFRMWLYASVGAGAASALAYRQQRRYAGRRAADVLGLPGCSLEEACQGLP